MRENRTSGSEERESDLNRTSLPLSVTGGLRPKAEKCIFKTYASGYLCRSRLPEIAEAILCLTATTHLASHRALQRIAGGIPGLPNPFPLRFVSCKIALPGTLRRLARLKLTHCACFEGPLKPPGSSVSFERF